MGRWLLMVLEFAPSILQLFGLPPIVAQLAADGIQTAEAALGAGTGAQKKTAVLTGVQAGVTALQQAGHLTGLGDPATLTANLSSGIDLVVGIVNQIHGAVPSTVPVGPVLSPALQAAVQKAIPGR